MKDKKLNKSTRQRDNKFVLKTSLYILHCTFFIFLFISCDNKNYQPKPRGYFRIDFPQKEYVKLDTMKYYSFEYPAYSEITPDYYSLHEKEWINIEYPNHKGTIHISYKTIEDNLDKYLEDSYSMMIKHISRGND